jgi:hypothetical protein
VSGVAFWKTTHRFAQVEGQLRELDGGRDVEGGVPSELLAERSTPARRRAWRFVVDSSVVKE